MDGMLYAFTVLAPRIFFDNYNCLFSIQHLFLDSNKTPKGHFFVVDGYHLSRCHGIDSMAKIIVKALKAEYGEAILRAGCNNHETYSVFQCQTCHLKQVPA